MKIVVGLAALASAGAIVALAAACGGDVAETPDACGTIDAGAHDAIAEDAPPWWADVFDAAIYQGFTAPIPGEYPPNGPGACVYSGCFINGTCDPESGWCCSGKPKKGSCACGADAGCVPPAICCALPGALEMRCVATPDQCPGIAR